MEDNYIEISVVSPVYKAENIVDKLIEEIIKHILPITPYFEIILVDDGSPDKSWDVISRNCANDKGVKGIKLSRNFGQHNAITAGLDNTKGDWIVVMDCDLQDQPKEIKKLYQKTKEGFDIVLARRAIRNDGFLKKMTSKLFYKVFSYLTDTKQDSAVANFGIYKKNVIDAIKSMGDYYRVFPILVQWVGFKRCYLDVEHAYRYEGVSTYNRLKLFRLAFDMIISFSEKPMRLGLKLGILVSLFSVVNCHQCIIKYLIF